MFLNWFYFKKEKIREGGEYSQQFSQVTSAQAAAEITVKSQGKVFKSSIREASAVLGLISHSLFRLF